MDSSPLSKPTFKIDDSDEELQDPDAPLNPDEFRLVRLEPRATEPGNAAKGEPIRCVVERFKIGSCPPYKALSYTCGPPILPHHLEGSRLVFDEDNEQPPQLEAEVIRNRVPFRIYKNLGEGLQQLHSIGINGWLWVDILCINQQDRTERTAQVQLMGKIYSSAESVIIWLGKGDPETESVFTIVNEFVPALKLALNEGRLSLSDLHSASLFQKKFINEIRIDNLLRKLSVFVLYCRLYQWFNRIWTMQELILAKDAYIYCGTCGSRSSSWSQLRSVLYFYHWAPKICASLDSICGTMFDWLLNIRKMFLYASAETPVDLTSHLLCHEPRSNAVTGGSPWPESNSLLHLYRIMNDFSSARSFDGRDKLHAVLGIFQKQVGGRLPDGIGADYENSTEEVYSNLTVHVIKRTSCLDVLSYASHPLSISNPTLRSWVPDYRVFAVATPLFAYHSRVTNRFDAADGMPYLREVDVTAERITCLGLCFDHVTEITTFGSRHELTPWRQVLEFGRGLPIRIYGRRRLEVLWRTLLIDTTKDLSKPSPEVEKSFVLWVAVADVDILRKAKAEPTVWQRSLESYFDLISNFDQADDENCRLDTQAVRDYYDMAEADQRDTILTLQESLTVEQHAQAVTPFEETFSFTGSDRRLFITERGLLGLGATCVQPNDQIWLLSNTHTPMILRPTETPSTFRFVGDCFILDHMNGEILRNEPELNTKIETITIV